MSDTAPWPTELRVRPRGVALRASFDDGQAFDLPSPLLRAMTPSAEARGHGGPDFTPLPGIAPEVTIRDVVPVGRYAVRLTFSDGHATGLYPWDRLHRIGRERVRLEGELARAVGR